jgi:two-component system sensor histidine kinase KdpD
VSRNAGSEVVDERPPRSPDEQRIGNTGRVETRAAGRLGRWRLAGGWLLVVVGMPALTAGLVHARSTSSGLSLESMCFLSLTVLAALVGGRWPGLVGALVAALLLNYYFTPPVHTLTVDRAPDVLTLVVFLVTAVAVSAVVDAAARRREQAASAESEAATLAMLNRSVLGGEYDVPRLLDLARATFGAEHAELVTEEPVPVSGAAVVPAGAGGWLVLAGASLGPRERSVAQAFASHVGVLREREELVRQSMAARQLEAGNRTRTALLAAVSHDLRTPLAGLRSATETLQTHDHRLEESERHELLDAMESSISRLTTMVSDLLDMSRLETGAVTPIAHDVPLGEVVRRSLAGLQGAERVHVGELPTAYVDPGLLERVVANLVANALRFSDAVEVEGETCPTRVTLRVVDHGPGVEPALRSRIFEPFQRKGDVGTGVGLGLAVARGLTEAQGGTLEAVDTSGGGLTMVLDLPGAEP